MIRKGLMRCCLPLRRLTRMIYDTSLAQRYNQIRPGYPPQYLDAIVRATGGEPETKQQTLLDLASGSGQVVETCGHLFGRVVATDISPAMCELVRDRAQSKGMSVQCIAAASEDLASLPEPVEADVVIGGQCLHWMALPRFWQTLRTILAPGGTFICSFYGPNFRFVGGAGSEATRQQANELLPSLYDAIGHALPNSNLFVAHFDDYPFPFASVERERIAWRRRLTFAEVAHFTRTGAALNCYNKMYAVPYHVDGFLESLREALGGVADDDAFEIEWTLTVITCKEMQ